MEGDSFSVLNAAEIEHYVQSLHCSKMEEFGSERWLEMHQYIQKLGQQAVLEASEHREEIVKDVLSTQSKLPVLVHEAICVSVWREKVLPVMLHLDESPRDTFPVYMVLFHEACAIGLLETVLYHQESCEALEDSALDLLDYCVAAILKISSGFKCLGEVLNMSCGEAVREQECLISFNIGIRCISILQYLIESLASLPLSMSSRMYVQHDIPLLITHLLEERPWERENPKFPGQKLKYLDGNWIEVHGEDSLKLTRCEGHAWLALRQLLLKETCVQYYEFSEFRKSQLQKMLRYLTDPLLDQLAPLMDLKYFLCHLQMSPGPSACRKPLILEVVPEIRQSILDLGSRRWRKIARSHIQALFQGSKENVQKMAQVFSSTYDLNVIERLSSVSPKCAECGQIAEKRCSRCKVEWYCGRECQVKNWTKHKQVCNSVAENLDS